jgi:hypothetical protein
LSLSELEGFWRRLHSICQLPQRRKQLKRHTDAVWLAWMTHGLSLMAASSVS